jgi:uncharacterized membrane protein YfcA
MTALVIFFATFLGAVVAGLAGFAFGLIASAIWLHVRGILERREMRWSYRLVAV